MCVNCCIRVNTVRCGFNFCGDQIFLDFVRFLSMKFYKHAACLRYNICSA